MAELRALLGPGEVPPERDFLPAPFRLYIADTWHYEPSITEVETFRSVAPRARRSAGPTATYRIGSYQLERDDELFRVDDVLIQIYDGENGERMAWPPAVIVSEAIPIRRTTKVIQLLRERIDLNPYSVKDLEAHLRSHQAPSRLDSQRWIRSAAVREAIVGAWSL